MLNKAVDTHEVLIDGTLGTDRRTSAGSDRQVVLDTLALPQKEKYAYDPHP
jgi:hypothetical protein